MISYSEITKLFSTDLERKRCIEIEFMVKGYHRYHGAFYSMDDEKRRIYPRISIAANVGDKYSLQDIFFTLAHEITHYYQWYFLEDNKRTDRSLEIEANKWAKYILELYFMNILKN